jgi:SHS family lactate transporter-like MFS transporter
MGHYRAKAGGWQDLQRRAAALTFLPLPRYSGGGSGAGFFLSLKDPARLNPPHVERGRETKLMTMESDPTASLIKDQRNALLAGFLGWTLDAFDYFLVPISVVSIAKEFNVSTPKVTFSLTLTLMFRPIGAFLFGLLADRYGRRLPLMLDLIFYSIVELLTGFAPNLTTFLVLRALFGIGMGGEWGVGASLAMEKVPPRWRGLLSGLLQEGYATGNLIASLVGLLVLPSIGDKVIFHIGGHACFGWRILFFIGGIPALLALFVRYGIKESEVWEKTKHATWGDLSRAILSHWKLMIGMTVLMMFMMCSSHGTQDLYPTFLKSDFRFTQQRVLTLNAVTAIGAIFGGLTFGLWSDRIGRRKSMILAFVLAIVVTPLWACWPESIIGAPTVTKLVIGGFLIQFGVQGAWGIIPAHISELSPDSVRGFLPGFTYQLGAVLSSALPWIQDEFKPMSGRGYGQILVITALGVFILAILVISLGREMKGVVFGEGHGSA